MWSGGLLFLFLWTSCQSSYVDEATDGEMATEAEAEDMEQEVQTTERARKSRRISRATPAGIAEYRSALTLDYLSVEDRRQQDIAGWYSGTLTPLRLGAPNCREYQRPAAGKVARLLLEMFKNLEGGNGSLTIELVQHLIHANLLMESKYFEEEPDLQALLKVPESLRGEPHATFPKILSMLWFTLTDPGMVQKQGWCSIKTTSKFIAKNRPKDIAKQMRILDPVLARARYIVEEFIQHVTPISLLTTKMPEEKSTRGARRKPGPKDDSLVLVNEMPPVIVTNRPAITVPMAKMPFLDGDGRLHETVNVLRDHAPDGPLPNVQVADDARRTSGDLNFALVVAALVGFL